MTILIGIPTDAQRKLVCRDFCVCMFVNLKVLPELSKNSPELFEISPELLKISPELFELSPELLRIISVII